MQPVGIGNSRISTDYAQHSPTDTAKSNRKSCKIKNNISEGMASITRGLTRPSPGHQKLGDEPVHQVPWGLLRWIGLDEWTVGTLPLDGWMLWCRGRVDKPCSQVVTTRTNLHVLTLPTFGKEKPTCLVTTKQRADIITSLPNKDQP